MLLSLPTLFRVDSPAVKSVPTTSHDPTTTYGDYFSIPDNVPSLAQTVEDWKADSSADGKANGSPSRPLSKANAKIPTAGKLPSPFSDLEAEDFDENIMYRVIKGHHPQILRDAEILCLPHSKTLDGNKITKEFIASHAFVPSPYFSNQFQSLNGKAISIESTTITTGTGYDQLRQIAVLSDECIYEGSPNGKRPMCKLRMLGITAPLIGAVESQPRQTVLSIPQCRLLERDAAFLDSIPDAQHAVGQVYQLLREFAETYVLVRGFTSHAVEKLRGLHYRAAEIVLTQSATVQQLCQGNTERANFEELLENIIFGQLHSRIYVDFLLPEYLLQDQYLYSLTCTYLSSPPSLASLGVNNRYQSIPIWYFDKAIKSVQSIDAHQRGYFFQSPLGPEAFDNLGISHPNQFYKTSISGEDEVTYPSVLTPLDRLERLKLTLDHINEAIQRFERETGHGPMLNDDSHKVASASSDDLIPLLILVILHAQMTNLASIAYYVDKFRIKRARSDLSFACVTFIAAVQYLKSDPLRRMLAIRQRAKSVQIRTSPYVQNLGMEHQEKSSAATAVRRPRAMSVTTPRRTPEPPVSCNSPLRPRSNSVIWRQHKPTLSPIRNQDSSSSSQYMSAPPPTPTTAVSRSPRQRPNFAHRKSYSADALEWSDIARWATMDEQQQAPRASTPTLTIKPRIILRTSPTDPTPSADSADFDIDGNLLKRLSIHDTQPRPRPVVFTSSPSPTPKPHRLMIDTSPPRRTSSPMTPPSSGSSQKVSLGEVTDLPTPESASPTVWQRANRLLSLRQASASSPSIIPLEHQRDLRG